MRAALRRGQSATYINIRAFENIPTLNSTCYTLLSGTHGVSSSLSLFVRAVVLLSGLAYFWVSPISSSHFDFRQSAKSDTLCIEFLLLLSIILFYLYLFCALKNSQYCNVRQYREGMNVFSWPHLTRSFSKTLPRDSSSDPSLFF